MLAQVAEMQHKLLRAAPCLKYSPRLGGSRGEYLSSLDQPTEARVDSQASQADFRLLMFRGLGMRIIF